MAESFPDAALDSLIHAFSARDLDKTLAGLSFKHGPTVVGSEEGEFAHGREAVEAFFTRIYDQPRAFVSSSRIGCGPFTVMLRGWLPTAW